MGLNFLVSGSHGLRGNPYLASPCHHRMHSHAEHGNEVNIRVTSTTF